MSTKQLKEELILRIQSEDDDIILQECLNVLQSDKGAIYKLPDELLEGLDEIEAEMDAGNWVSHEDVMAGARKLLAEQTKRLTDEKSKMVPKSE